MQLAQVVSPGTSGYSMVPGVMEAQYKEINEFPLSKQFIHGQLSGIGQWCNLLQEITRNPHSNQR